MAPLVQEYHYTPWIAVTPNSLDILTSIVLCIFKYLLLPSNMPKYFLISHNNPWGELSNSCGPKIFPMSRPRTSQEIPKLRMLQPGCYEQKCLLYALPRIRWHTWNQDRMMIRVHPRKMMDYWLFKFPLPCQVTQYSINTLPDPPLIFLELVHINLGPVNPKSSIPQTSRTSPDHRACWVWTFAPPCLSSGLSI